MDVIPLFREAVHCRAVGGERSPALLSGCNVCVMERDGPTTP